MIYAGFSYREDIYNKLETGDVVSIYIKGREAQIYLEEKSKQYLKDRYKDERVNVKPLTDRTDCPFYFSMNNITTYKHIIEDALEFLNNNTSSKWTFEGFGGTMGGYFSNDKNKKLEITIARCGFKEHSWSMERVRFGYSSKGVPPKEFKEIANMYAKHL